ncbi:MULTISPECIES: LLM class F420-dependent oxidoreductase [unclassified Minwuia]|jgi:probable F420-dependent oxidoreductase|uniref:LLM class F420-dependent oxidoreductase n=1 Tax=unclassified Minwuia TaxID=2618799 RepID=UPI00247B1731|nr:MULTISPECIES: LLM class F420-dependent oxidoreductase [unclassified Minwuia]
MKFGLRYCNTGPYVDPDPALELLQAAEEAGFDSAWTVEHTVVPAGYGSAYPYAQNGKMAGGVEDLPLPDPLIWMAYVAAGTSRIRLGTGILILPQHSPVHVAKQVATLDHLCGGRTLLGIGVGWLAEEFAALGQPFGTRGPRTDECVAALRALWGEQPASFQGEHVSFAPMYCVPRPVAGAVPIIVGGHSKAAARRAGRLGDGFFPAREAPQDLIQLARDTAEQNGRNPAALEITVSMPEDRALLEDYARMGIDRVLVPVSDMAGLATAIRTPEETRDWSGLISQYA